MKKKTKKRILVTIVLILVLFWFLPFSVSSQTDGVYNSSSQLMWCGNGICEHEMAHYMDDQMGFPSQSEEFKKVVLNDPFNYSFNKSILGFSPEYAELYASIFANYRKNGESIPEVFKPFYNWDIINRFDINYENGGFYWLVSFLDNNTK